MTSAARPLPQPLPTLVAALPTLDRLEQQLADALGPAMNADAERDSHEQS